MMLIGSDFFYASLGCDKAKDGLRRGREIVRYSASRSKMNHYGSKGSTSRYYLLKLPDQVDRYLTIY